MAVIILGALLVTDIRFRGLKSLQHIGPLQNAAILVIVIGAAILVVGIFGCISVGIKSKPMVLSVSSDPLVQSCLKGELSWSNHMGACNVTRRDVIV